jgi:hypothetical protein
MHIWTMAHPNSLIRNVESTTELVDYLVFTRNGGETAKFDTEFDQEYGAHRRVGLASLTRNIGHTAKLDT